MTTLIEKIIICTIISLFSIEASASVVRNVECNMPPLPSGSKVMAIAPRMAINGTPMSIYALTNKLAPEQIMDFYKHRWMKDGHPAYVKYRVGIWKVIAHLREDCFYTVQVQPDASGTEGLIGISMPGEAKGMPQSPNVPVLGGTRVINELHSDDDGKIAWTWYLGNHDSVETNANFYITTLVRQGWQKQMANHAPKPRGAEVLLFQKGTESISMTIEPASFGSTILLDKILR